MLILAAFFLVSTGVLLQCCTSQGNLSVALVEICLVNTFSSEYFLFYLCWLTYIIISVSAVPVGASDRVAGLLNRKWWQR